MGGRGVAFKELDFFFLIPPTTNRHRRPKTCKSRAAFCLGFVCFAKSHAAAAAADCASLLSASGRGGALDIGCRRDMFM